MIKRWIEPAIVEKVETVAADVYGNEQLRDVQQRFERAVKSIGDKQIADDANSLFNLACAVSVVRDLMKGWNLAIISERVGERDV